MLRALVLLLLATPALAECPPLPERSARHSALMAQVANATDEAAAQALNTELWQIWTTAPDAAAQELLDRGMQRRASYDFLGAISDFDALIAYCPHYAEGYNQRAFAYFLSGEMEPALADLDRTLDITSDHIGAWSGKALVLIALGRLREGQLVLRQALQLNPWLPERHQLIPLEDLPKLDREL